MRTIQIFILASFLSSASLFGQTYDGTAPELSPNGFDATQCFLSSDWMEGRETGTRGSFMAADYIATVMQQYGLKPFGGKAINGRGQSYFQDFELIRYKIDNASLAFISSAEKSQSSMMLTKEVDFTVISAARSMDAEAPAVFVGYGLSMPDNGYDDYKGLDIKGKIVILLVGFPGHTDTTSAAWNKIGKKLKDGWALRKLKYRTAAEHGAIAVIILTSDENYEVFRNKQANLSILKSTMNSEKKSEDYYDEDDYVLPDDSILWAIPSFSMGSNANSHLFAGTDFHFSEFESKVARQVIPSSFLLKNKIIKFSVIVKQETLIVRNVLGLLPGVDSTKSVVVGAHYDHLGIRNGLIYNGADDNASGVSGVLALAKAWANGSIHPPCNLIFAAWTAEEKGLLGSSYFMQNSNKDSDNILLYMNMDMISRNATDDTSKLQLSIGTRTSDAHLREIARKCNSLLDRPFKLDLWDVTGHSGSDYASFTAKNIPVMTFFSGFHDDYHTPRDIFIYTDRMKMVRILKMVNNCLSNFLNTLNEK